MWWVSAREFRSKSQSSKTRKQNPNGMLGTLTRSGSMFFDNRKAGKSTPITWQGLRFLLGQWCGLFTSLLENRAILWKKRRLIQSRMLEVGGEKFTADS